MPVAVIYNNDFTSFLYLIVVGKKPSASSEIELFNFQYYCTYTVLYVDSYLIGLLSAHSHSPEYTLHITTS